MSTRKISIAQLRKGMFIHELDIPWIKSPFLRHRRKINADNDIALLKKAGVKHLYIDLSRSGDIQEAVKETVEESIPSSQTETPAEGSLLSGEASLLSGEASLLSGEASLLSGEASLLSDEVSPLSSEASLHSGEGSLHSGEASSNSVSTPDLAPDLKAEKNDTLAEKTVEKQALSEELKVAKVLQGKIGKLVNQLGSMVKEGRAISAQSITPVINEALESISRNDQALLTILHLQRQDLQLSDHGFGVFAIILPLAIKLGCTEKEVNELGMAALLHDTGWSRLPIHLFGKKKAYTSAEKQLIQQHPAIVESVLNKSSDFPATVKLLVSQHHERSDGSGYPNKLKKDRIHRLAEILQVADLYDEYIHGLTDQPGMLPANALKKIYQAARNGLFSETVVSEMIHVMGIFPLTSAIELSNGEKALVIEIDKQKPLLPRVKIVYEADGQPCKSEKIIDLANQNEADKLKIIKVIDPIDKKKDPLGLLRVNIA